MLFNSLTFIAFLPVVFCLYWALNGHLRLQNLAIVGASYVFYGWWDWRFLVLIAFTSAWAYVFGLLPKSKLYVAISVVVNLGILCSFKYYNFFVDSFCAMLGLQEGDSSVNLILPVGISFYTFQALSYTLDVYRGTVQPTKDVVAFFAYISFFPQLVAGPIERAANLLPQFLKARCFDYVVAVEGSRQMLWGFAKKVLVADYCAETANRLLENGQHSSIALWIGMLFFTFQIYGDFSGYSDIAIGCAKLFGFRLMRNFAYPYFARDIAEFWRRWHMSLTTWFRDYLYIPLGGSRCGTYKKIRNTFVIFAVSGLWHGANWTFAMWGVFHAACFMPLLVMGKNRRYVGDYVAAGRCWPSLAEVVKMVATFLLVVVGWTFFRAPDINTAFSWVGRMLSFSSLVLQGVGLSGIVVPIVCVVSLLLVEWCNRMREIPALPCNRLMRWTIYVSLASAIIFFHPDANAFIYFQF